MKSNEPEQTDFVLLGSYPPREATKLLERFHPSGNCPSDSTQKSSSRA